MRLFKSFCFARLILLMFLSLSEIAEAQEKLITPDGFKWMSRTSIDIMKTYRNYKSFIEENNPKFLFDAHTIQTAQDDYSIHTSLGMVSVGPLQGELAIYFRWQVMKKLKLGFFAFVNRIDLQINDKLHSDLTDPEGPYGNLYAWKSGKSIIAVSPHFNPEIIMTIGALITQYPYVTFSNDSTEQFDIDYDEEKEKYLTYKDKQELFFIGNFYGYELGTIYEFEENSFSLIELKRFFEMSEKIGHLALGFNHYDFRKTYQLGLEYDNRSLFSIFPVHLEAYWNIYKDKKWNDIGYFLFSTRQTFLKENSIASPAEEKKDFYIGVDTGISYSKDLFAEGLTGYFINFDLTNIWGYWRNFILGYSYNFHDYLNRLPIKNDHKIVVAFRVMI